MGSKRSTLAALRTKIAVIEGSGAAVGRVQPLGLAPVDAVLPGGGLALGAVHEVTGSAAGGFVSCLLGRLDGSMLWCVGANDRSGLYGPGLAAFGIDVSQVTVAFCRDQTDMLWAMEEGLRTPGLAAVVGEPSSSVDMAASRRLQLAAETGGALGLVLGRGRTGGKLAANALVSRWQADAVPADHGTDQELCWDVRLRRCRGGLGTAASRWHVMLSETMEGDYETTGCFAMADASIDRPLDAPVQLQLAG